MEKADVGVFPQRGKSNIFIPSETRRNLSFDGTTRLMWPAVGRARRVCVPVTRAVAKPRRVNVEPR